MKFKNKVTMIIRFLDSLYAVFFYLHYFILEKIEIYYGENIENSNLK